MDYEKQATDFLAASGLEFRAVLIGSDCPPFCEDAQKSLDMDKVDVFPRRTHIHGKHYRCTISGQGRGHVSFDFWNSYHDCERNWAIKNPWEAQNVLTGIGRQSVWESRASANKAEGRKRAVVKPYDVLACIQKHDVGTLADFCSEMGYDEDSKRAEQIYVAVCKEYQKTRKFFTAAELEALQEIQ